MDDDDDDEGSFYDGGEFDNGDEFDDVPGRKRTRRIIILFSFSSSWPASSTPAQPGVLPILSSGFYKQRQAKGLTTGAILWPINA